MTNEETREKALEALNRLCGESSGNAGGGATICYGFDAKTLRHLDGNDGGMTHEFSCEGHEDKTLANGQQTRTDLTFSVTLDGPEYADVSIDED